MSTSTNYSCKRRKGKLRFPQSVLRYYHSFACLLSFFFYICFLGSQTQLTVPHSTVEFITYVQICVELDAYLILVNVTLSLCVSRLLSTEGLAFVFGLFLGQGLGLLFVSLRIIVRRTLYDRYLSVFLGRSDGEVYEKGEETLCDGY